MNQVETASPRPPALVAELAGNDEWPAEGRSRFLISRNGEPSDVVVAGGPMSALIVFGQQHPELDTDAVWTVERAG